jgi:hypothetical protein
MEANPKEVLEHPESIKSAYRPQLVEKASFSMRQPIETAPRDGNVIILEDDAAGTYDVAQWSSELNDWICESGKPSKIMPSYWHPMPVDRYQEDGGETSSRPSVKRRFAPASLAAALIVSGLIAAYFNNEVDDLVTRYVGQHACSMSRSSHNAPSCRIKSQRPRSRRRCRPKPARSAIRSKRSGPQLHRYRNPPYR